MRRIVIIFVCLAVTLIFPNIKEPLAQKYQLVLKPELKEAINDQIEKEKDRGYVDFKLLYAKEVSGRVRVIYSAINTELDSSYIGTDKWLLGFTFSNNNGQWFYGGGQSKAYLKEDDFEDMKKWAKKVSYW